MMNIVMHVMALATENAEERHKSTNGALHIALGISCARMEHELSGSSVMEEKTAKRQRRREGGVAGGVGGNIFGWGKVVSTYWQVDVPGEVHQGNVQGTPRMVGVLWPCFEKVWETGRLIAVRGLWMML